MNKPPDIGAAALAALIQRCLVGLANAEAATWELQRRVTILETSLQRAIAFDKQATRTA